MLARGAAVSAGSTVSESSASGSKLDHGPSGSPIGGDTTPAAAAAAIRVRAAAGYREPVLRRLLAATLVVTGWSIAAPVGTAPVRADSGLDESSTTTYTIDPTAGVVRVSVEVSVTNRVPDRTEGNTIYSRYYTGYGVAAIAATANAAAVDSRGRALTVTPVSVPEAPDFVLYDVDFAERLYFRQTAQFTLTYDIVGLPPRSDDITRANPAYVSFAAFGSGDSGLVNVRVVAPDGLEVELLGDPVETRRLDGATEYSAEAIADPDTFGVYVSARNDVALERTSVKVGANGFSVRSWPGDDEWKRFVEEQIVTGVPELEDLIGEPWPIDGELEVVQSSTPYLYGYAGWFSPRDLVIEVGEVLDQEVVLHELSHAWFNDQWFSDRWVNEGFAQVYSNAVVDTLGGAPLVPDPIDTSDAGFVVLNDWGDLSLDGDDEAREDYGYNASFAVMEQIVDEVGTDAMRDVFDAVAAGTLAYRGELPPEETTGAVDWRRFLDLVAEVGGSTRATELFEQYIVTASEQPQLDARDAARDRYAELLADSGTWAGPVVVRRHLNDWSFVDAEAAIGEAAEVLALRDTMIDKAVALGIGYPDDFEADYEAVDGSFDEVEAAIGEQIETFDLVDAAVDAEAADDGFFETIGLWGTDVPAAIDEAERAAAEGDHDGARAAAQAALDTVEQASEVGARRFAIAVGSVLGAVVSVTLLMVLIRRRRARRSAPTMLDEPDGPDGPAAAVEGAVAE